MARDAQDKTLAETRRYQLRVRTHVSTVDLDLEQLRIAIEPLGEIIDYEPRVEDADDFGTFHLNILIESNASLYTLQATLAHLKIVVEEAPVVLPETTPNSPEIFENMSISAMAMIENQTRNKPELLGIYRENPDHPSWASVDRGQTLYRIRVLFLLATFDKILDEFKTTLEPHGVPLAYAPAGLGDDEDFVEMDVWFASAVSEDALRRIFAQFAETFH